MSIRVLMIGPDRSVHGGISGVVNNWYEAGLNKSIRLIYIGTMAEGSKVRKLLKAAAAYARFIVKLPGQDIVHVNVASDMSYVRKSVFIRTAHFFGKKLVIHQHGGDFEGYYGQLTGRKQAKIRKVLGMADRFLVLSPQSRLFFEGLVDREKLTVLPNGVRIPDKRKTENKQYGIHQILFLGRICKEKGIRELLGAFKRLAAVYPKLHLYMGGIFEDESLREPIEEQQKQVTLLGWVEGKEKEKWLQECDIFVLPSYFEGQPVSVLEAMAYGCGIVAAEVGGIPQMIVPGETGVLIKPRNEQALYEGLLSVIQDPESQRFMGKNARKKAEEDFAVEKMTEKLIRVYRELV